MMENFLLMEADYCNPLQAIASNIYQYQLRKIFL